MNLLRALTLCGSSLCASSLVLVGCGAYGLRVPDGMLAKLPYESRIELLEAENDLALGIDRLDEARAESSRTRAALRRANERYWAARGEVGAAQDATGREVAELAVQEAEARAGFLSARQRVNATEEAIAEVGLKCAQARFERARLEVARKAKVQGSEGLSASDFDGQVKACEAEVAQRRQALNADERAKLTAARDAWDERRKALARKTFDARASPYVE